MPSIKKTAHVAALLLPFLIAGCGDGYEMQPYHGAPYDGRTAGSGVEYVLAHMAPAKTVDTTPQAPPVEAAKPVEEPAPAPAAPAPAPTTAPEKKGDAVFNKAMVK